MNILTKIRAINELNEKELRSHTANTPASWHHQYRKSAWVHIGGLSFKLTEGDIICAFSQYGEITQIHMPRDRETGKPRGFCFLCYEDARSAVLAVDNFNGINLAQRVIKVDHVLDFKPPKDSSSSDSEENMGMAEAYRRKKYRKEKRKRNRSDDPDFDHTARDIRKHGVAPKAVKQKKSKKSRNNDSDDGLLPYHGGGYAKISKEISKKKQEDLKKEEKERAKRDNPHWYK